MLSAAHERAAARAARNFAEADRLRAEIEAAGWNIADRGTDFALTPAAPPDTAEGERIRYGASANVPSRLDEAPSARRRSCSWRPTGRTTWHVPCLLSPTTRPRAHRSSSSRTRRPSSRPPSSRRSRQAAERAAWRRRSCGRASRLGQGAALNAGVRRAAGPVVIQLNSSVEPTGDFATPLVAALEDPAVALVGGWGIVSGDLRRFEEAPPGEVDAIEAYCLAFRRADFATRGPFDERFRFYRNLDIWWSLVLRDEGEGMAPRRAVALGRPAARQA